MRRSELGLGPDHRLDLGGGASAQFLAWHGDPSEQVIGIAFRHPHRLTGQPCEINVHFDVAAERVRAESGAPARMRWLVLSWQPLDLSPSIVCDLCGAHGFIRNGRWDWLP
jgi:hypothetical protein